MVIKYIEIEESVEVQTNFSSVLYARGTNLTHQCIKSIPECWLHLILIPEYWHFLGQSLLLDQNSGRPQILKTWNFSGVSKNTPFMHRIDYFLLKLEFCPIFGSINLTFYRIYANLETGVHFHGIDLKGCPSLDVFLVVLRCQKYSSWSSQAS